MSARKVAVSVECCDPDTGEIAITIEDPDNPDPDMRFQDLMMHPSVYSLVGELIARQQRSGYGFRHAVSLNNPPDSDQPGRTTP